MEEFAVSVIKENKNKISLIGKLFVEFVIISFIETCD